MNNEKLFKKMFKFAKELIDYQIYHRNRYIELKANREIPEGLIQRDFLFSELRLPRQIGKTTCLARLKGYLDAEYPDEPAVRQDRVEHVMLEPLGVVVVSLGPEEHLEVSIHVEQDEDDENQPGERHDDFEPHGRHHAALLFQ